MSMNVASPCVRLCQIDGQGLCRGCFRHLGEIAAWMRLSEEEKAAVLVAVEKRRQTYRQPERKHE